MPRRLRPTERCRMGTVRAKNTEATLAGWPRRCDGWRDIDQMAADRVVMPWWALAATDELVVGHRMVATVVHASEPSRIQPVPTDRLDPGSTVGRSPGTPPADHRPCDGCVLVIAAARRVAGRAATAPPPAASPSGCRRGRVPVRRSWLVHGARRRMRDRLRRAASGCLPSAAGVYMRSRTGMASGDDI